MSKSGCIKNRKYVALRHPAVDSAKAEIQHRHLHNSSRFQIGNCTVVCNPRDYLDEQNPEFSANVLINIERSLRRA